MIFFILLFSVGLGNEWWANSVVFDLTDANFEEHLGKSKHVVLEFYAPFCHWCRLMFHEYEELSKHYNGAESPWKRDDVLIARTNAQQFQHLSVAMYQIWSYPQIIFIPAHSKEKKSTFEGQRVKFRFIEWIDQQVKEANHDWEKKLMEMNQHEREQLEEKEKIEELSKNDGKSLDENVEKSEEIHEHKENIKESNHEEFEHNKEESSHKNEENSHKNEESSHENEESDEKKEEYNDKNEEFMQFEMVIEDVSSHTAEKWRGEFVALQISIDDLAKNFESNAQETNLAIYNIKSLFSEQFLKIAEKLENYNEKIQEINENIVNRNKIENTQSRFNLNHMLIFVTLGGIIGFALSIFFVKIRPTKDYNKV